MVYIYAKEEEKRIFGIKIRNRFIIIFFILLILGIPVSLLI